MLIKKHLHFGPSNDHKLQMWSEKRNLSKRSIKEEKYLKSRQRSNKT